MSYDESELKRKMEIMYKAEQELLRETKKLHNKDNELATEIDKINKKINELQQFINERAIIVDKKSHYSDAYIYEVRMKTSIHKAAKALGVSVSTVNRACARYREKMLGDFDI